MSISSSLATLRTAKTDIASAITDKGGTVGAGDGFSDFAADIATIPSGGGPAPIEDAPFNDVNFYDYDGTRLFSYTLAEATALAELPTPAGHDGLVFQEWNYTLEEVQSLIAPQDIGANYITDDGKTRFYIDIPTTFRTNVILRFNQTVAYGVEVDWGDDSPIETFSGTGDKSPTHLYQSNGKYVIALEVKFGEISLGLPLTGNAAIGKPSVLSLQASKSILFSCQIGDNTQIGANAFNSSTNLRSISIPISGLSNSSSTYMFSNCNSLRFISIPRGTVFTDSYALRQTGDFAGFTFVSFPATLTTIPGYLLESQTEIQRMTIPSGVTSIGNYAFRRLYAMVECYFLSITPPVLGGAAVFTSIPSDCTIYVPPGSLTAYQTATNWSAQAAKMKEIGT